jgi:hypothetical protein
LPKEQELTPGLIADFREHIVWKTILQRIQGPMSAAHNRAIDAADLRAGGEYRAYEMVSGLPAQLLREVEGSGRLGSRLKSALGR